MNRALEQKTVVKVWDPLTQAKVAGLPLSTFHIVTQACRNSKKHKTDTRKAYVFFLGSEGLVSFENASFPFSLSSLASWVALKHTHQTAKGGGRGIFS